MWMAIMLNHVKDSRRVRSKYPIQSANEHYRQAASNLSKLCRPRTRHYRRRDYLTSARRHRPEHSTCCYQQFWLMIENVFIMYNIAARCHRQAACLRNDRAQNTTQTTTIDAIWMHIAPACSGDRRVLGERGTSTTQSIRSDGCKT